jgi:hypothetical protein
VRKLLFLCSVFVLPLATAQSTISVFGNVNNFLEGGGPPPSILPPQISGAVKLPTGSNFLGER